MIVLGLALMLAGGFHPFHRMDNSARVKTLKEFVLALNTKETGKMETFLHEQFHARDESQTATTARANRFLELASLGAPFSIDAILVDEPKQCIARIKSSDGPEFELKVVFGLGLPYRATSIYMGGLGSQTEAPPKRYTDWKDLRDLLKQVQQDTKVPALSLVLLHDGHQQAVVVGNREMSSADPAKLTDTWLLGSITKSMTATMIALLVDRGVIRWDTTVGQVFPNYEMNSTYRSVTILQLLQHRAGIPQDLYVNPSFLKKAAGTETDLVKVREHYAQFTLARDPIFSPGEKMRYSNAGYSLAAHMAETLAKKPYEQLMSELLFRPLRMRSARFGIPGQPGNPGSAGHIMGYSYSRSGLQPNILSDPRIAGIQAAAGAGLSMTIEDLMNFVRFHLEGRRGHVKLMSKANFDVLHRPGSLGVGESTYACGWLTTTGYTREPFEGHNGSDGKFRADMAIWPERNLAIVAIANAGTTREPAPTLQAIGAVYERIDSQGKK